jgi:ATP-dependent 26S proteasome regulatory subunit
MDTLNESPLPLSWQMPPLERLSHIYMLRLFQEAARTQRPLRLMMKDRAELAAVLNADESALTRRKPATLLPQIVQRLAELEQGESPLESPLARGVLRFGAGFGLSAEECRILLFAVVAGADSYLDNALPSGTAAAGNDLDHLTAVATALPLAAVRAALSPGGLLIRSGLVQRYQRNYELSDRLQLIDGMAASFAEEEQALPFEQRWLARAPAPGMRLQEMSHLRAELETAIAVIKGALEQGNGQDGRGVQVLLYGEPGVGKTELARLIAAEAGAAAYLLPDAGSGGSPLGADVRLRRYAFMQRLLAQQPRSLIVLDEVEEMLASNRAWSGAPPSSPHKAWKNRLLEDSQVPGIWIGNWIHAIDPALLRRFALVLRVPNPPARVRLAMLARYGSGCEQDAQVRAVIARRDDLSPADIRRAHAAALLAEGHSGEAMPLRFLRALAMRAAGEGDPIVAGRRPVPSLPYRIEWLNTDPPLHELVPLLARAGSGRLCFWGPPGTGKTALARHLAEQLGRPLHIKKASDLISKWIGETERNIAGAFADARRDDALLLIDEADSFLASREGAQRSWELSQVNQLLKELEDYDGLVALCTNFFQTLDAAVLRRLDLKVRFARLSAAAAGEAFVEAAAVLGTDTQQAREVLRSTPLPGGAYALGDIAVALRHVRLRATAPDAVLLRDSLEAERRIRDQREGRAIGFVA